MKFSCEKDILLREISIAQEIISSRNSLSILSNVYLEVKENNLFIKATDLKVSFETDIRVEAILPGSITVFCDKLLGVLRSLPPGEVEFELKENTLLYIKPLLKKIDFQLKSIAADKYPEIKSIPKELYFNFPQKEFIDMISKTTFAVSDDETRYFMNGVFFKRSDQKLLMVATDGRRLSYISKEIDVDVKFEGMKGIIIPTKILMLGRKLLSGEGNFSIALTDKNIFLRSNKHKLSSNLIDGQFPNYERVIPEKQEYSAIIEKLNFLEALKRVSLLVEHKSNRIFLSFENDILTITSAEGEIGRATEEIPCQYKGPEVTIAVNYQYIIDPLREMEEDQVLIQFTETDKAMTIGPEPVKDFFHIVMPMQSG